MVTTAKILVACEYSGIVSQAFEKKGHFVVSCDLLPSSHIPHYQGNCLDILHEKWDMLIAFPPCTYLTSAQTWRVKTSPGRKEKQIQALEFFKKLHQATHIPLRCIENPPGEVHRLYIKQSQTIRPGMFGNPHFKNICLWLVGLPPLISTVYNFTHKSMQNHVNSSMSGEKKSMIKSKFFPEVAEAMANQWQKAIIETINL